MRHARRRTDPNVPLEPIDSYHAIFFQDVSEAVDWCDRLVPAVVERQARGCADRPAVWFHVPSQPASAGARGCYLFASPGAMDCIARAGLAARAVAPVPRHLLPAGSVLVLGVDAPLPLQAVDEARRALDQPALADIAPAAYVTPRSVSLLRYPGPARPEAARPA